MSEQLSLEQATQNIYDSLNQNNLYIDDHIDALKTVLTAEGTKEVTLEKEKLAQNNREGRKMLQSYFKKRGVLVKLV